MIARLLRLILAVEVVSAVIAAALALRWLGHSLGPVVAAGLGMVAVFAVHPLIIAVNFAISRSARSEPPAGLRLSLTAALATFAREYGASVRGFNWAHPFFAQRKAPDATPPLQPWPILFVHGYFCNRAIWLPLMRAAARRGYRVDAVTLEPPFDSIELYVDRIDSAFSRLLEANSTRQGIVVCHSMGGLAARAWMRRCGDERVRHVFTLGSPHSGTVMAARGKNGNVAQMRRDSPWLAQLASSESPSRRARITSVFSYHDDIVAPQRSSFLEGARNIELAGLGHVSLVYSRRIWAILFGELQSLQRAEEADATARDLRTGRSPIS